MLIVPVRLDVGKEPENVVAVMMPADIVIAVPTLSSVKVETPEEALIFDVIKSGNLASLIVPVVIFAPSDKLVAVVAIPVTFPVRFPMNVVAVTIPADIVIAVPTLSSVKVEIPPFTLPFTLPVILPKKVVAVTIPVTSTLPNTENSGSEAPGLVVVLIPSFEVV